MTACGAYSAQGNRCAREVGHEGCHEVYVDGDGRRWWGDARSHASEAAVAAVRAYIDLKGPKVLARERTLLGKAHDPALGLERSVCLRDVVEALDSGEWASYYEGGLHDARDFIEREFGGGS